MCDAWNILKALCPWPGIRPLEPDKKIPGWLRNSTAQMLHAHLPNDGIVIELGSWMGLSARFILDCRPNVRLICIDHWKGDPDSNQQNDPLAKDKFLSNCWEFQDRMIPIECDTVAGLFICNSAKIKADLIYVDASHSADAVQRDIEACKKYHPYATLVGDDWRRTSVQAGVSAALGTDVEHNKTAWSHVPK